MKEFCDTPYLRVYRIQLKNLELATGSRNQSLVAAIVKCARPIIDKIDRHTEGEFSCELAIAEIIDGIDSEEMDEEWDFVYSWGYVAICMFLGEEVGAIGPIPEPVGTFTQAFDAALCDVGGPPTARLGHLCYNGPLVDIPPAPSEIPALGYWTPENIDEVRPYIERAAALDHSSEISQALSEVRQWLRRWEHSDGYHWVGVLT